MRPFFLSRFQPQLLSVLRIVTGLLFMQHGLQKIFGLFGGMGGPGQTVELASRYGVAGTLETFGGALIVLGLFTRPVAFILSGEMAFAYFLAHFPRGFFPIENRGEVVVLFCFVYLFLAAAGAGPWSVDALLGRGSGRSRLEAGFGAESGDRDTGGRERMTVGARRAARGPAR
ncbi:MAG TPA: DoxX family protein [Gemmatimonadaceae bacterium]|nr:DoxX family protein [Gemmatimonadaceae bacterium]